MAGGNYHNRESERIPVGQHIALSIDQPQCFGFALSQSVSFRVAFSFTKRKRIAVGVTQRFSITECFGQSVSVVRYADCCYQ